MAWDTQETRRRLKEAATVEFAERGPDGTTVARIAARAGINKERLYKYFGDKRALFQTVLTDELEKLAAALPAEYGPGAEDIGDYAGKVFDYHRRHPRLLRLLMWEGLAGGPPVDELNRTQHYRAKVAAVTEAQRAGVLDDSLSPDHLVFLVIALGAWWMAVPQLATMLTGADDEAEHARRRESVMEAARRLAAPRR